MPQTFESIANSKGDPTSVTMYTPGGTGFINHVNDPNVYNHFQAGNWDYVVLQPGSNESPGYSEPIDATLSRARILKDSILFYNPCTKILYYEISYGVWGNTPANLDTYNTTMDLIRANLEYLSDSTELFFAPAGESIRTAWNTDQTTMLWGGNGDIHPNAKGSYIIACSFYASIFQKPSFGTSEISSLTALEASNYQELADTTVLNHLSDWRINTYNQFTDFDNVVNQSTVDFTSTSQNIDSLTWDFGDGNTSNTSSTTHTYAQNGSFDIVLTTYNGNCVETKTKTVTISTIELNEIHPFTTRRVFPNPFIDRITVENCKKEEILFSNLLGQDFNNVISINESSNGLEVDTRNLPKGTYILATKTSRHLIYKK